MPYSSEPYVRRVFYYETDKMGIVHHSNFIRWMEEARISYMSEMGFGYDEMEKMGIIMPVTAVSCRYVRSVRFNEEIRIYTKLKFFNGVRAEYVYEIYTESGGEAAAFGESGHCFLDEAKRVPISVKKRYPEFFEKCVDILKR